MKTRSLNLSANVAKRTEEARRAQMRADNMLNKRLYEAGGLEDIKRMQFENIKREQINLRHQLEVIKHKHQLNDTNVEEDGSEMSCSEEDHVPNNHDSAAKGGSYGRNYFGYKSSPGSNKTMNPNRNISYRAKENKKKYSTKITTNAEREVHKKLRQEQTKYREFQNKARTFGNQEWDVSSSTKSNGLKQTDVKTAKDAITDRLLSHKEEKISPVKLNPTTTRKRSIVIPSSQFPSFMELPKTLYSAGNADIEFNDATSIKSKQTESSLLQSSASKTRDNGKVKTALDLVFDEELYAPDGRIRMMHRLPDFKQSLKEAKSARYTRTKYKREIEKELSIDEIFSTLQQSTPQSSFRSTL